VVNDCLFFAVEADEGEIPEGGTARVLVRPNMAAIHQNRRLFLKEKYIEEHITVYSYHPQRFTERSFVAIRLVLGHLPSDVFYTSPGTHFNAQRVLRRVAIMTDCVYVCVHARSRRCEERVSVLDAGGADRVLHARPQPLLHSPRPSGARAAA
jgi:hypothetical protein